MSCTPPLLLQHAVEKIENINHSILTYCMMKCLRAGPYNGKTTLQYEYRIIHEKKRKSWEKIMYDMFFKGDVI